MYVVGLTGGIGSGKTVVSDMFAGLGITVVDADVVARQVVEPGTEALGKIAERFGAGVLDEDGTLNRAALRKTVFASEQHRLWLEQLLHPLIGAQMQQQLQQSTSAYQLQVAPLLLERGRPPHLQRVLVVDAPESLQIQRTTARDSNTTEQVQAIMDKQLTRAQRLEMADDVLLNDGDLDALSGRVNELHSAYMQLATRAQTSQTPQDAQ